MNIDEQVLDLLLQWETQVATGEETAVESLAEGDPVLAEDLQRYAAALQKTGWLARHAEDESKLSLPSGQSLSCTLILPEGLELRKFRAQLMKADILDAEEVERIVSRPEIKSAYQLSGALLEEGLLTKFQLRAIAHGRTRGLRLGRYIILDRIGAGGMGQVFRAQHSRMQREVALKVLPRESMSKPQAVERFLREVRAAASVVHRNIVTAYDADEAEGLHFLVMEYVEGHDLSALVRKNGPLRVTQAVDFLTQAAQGLEYAHGQGLVHRDIKPANLLVDSEGVVKILDMGIARFEQKAGHTNPELTQEGSAMGTVDYMPPEQAIDSKSVDARADLYSLGCTLHYLLVGKPPFDGDTMMVKLLGHRETAPPNLCELRRDVPQELNTIFQRLLAKSPEDRYSDATELLAALEAVTPLVTARETKVGADLGKGRSESELDTSPTGFLQTISQVGLGSLLPGTRASGDKTTASYAKPMLYGGIGMGLLLSLALVYFAVAAIFPSTPPPPDMAAPTPEAIAAETTDPEPNPEPEVEPDVEEEIAANRSESPPADTTASLEASASPPEAPAWQPTPEQQAFIDEVATLPVADQAATVARKLQEINPGFDGEFEQKIEEEKVTEFSISTVEVADIWPVRALVDLQALRCEGTREAQGKLADLSALSGMPLSSLSINRNQVKDLSPLAGMPLSWLWFSKNQVSDLSPLTGMKLSSFAGWSNSYSDLSPLRGAPLTYLDCSHTQTADLSPLSGCPLAVIAINSTLTTSLEPLRNAPVRKLVFSDTLISNLQPLLSFPVDDVRFPILLFHSPEEALFRSLPASRLGNGYNHSYMAEDFWKRFEDHRRAAEQFAEETSRLRPDQQITRIESKLAELNDTDEISLTTTRNGDAIESAVVRLTSEASDITPLRSLSHLKRLTIESGSPWLDLSPINSLPIEDLICRQEQAMRNRLMLADMETLKTINGQPAEQYLEFLKELSQPQDQQPAATIPTEEEILAAHPPLEQWLEGREILTVAQDGSAMFTTIQAALDAQEEGQVVQVLDKGPYRESLYWTNKTNCGLISQVGTIIETVEWKGYYDDYKESQRFQTLVDCRLSGLTFAYSPQDENENTPLRFTGTVNLCMEDCVVIPSGPVPQNCNPRIEVVNTTKQRRIGTACVRNCVLVISHLQYVQRGEADADEKDQPAWLAIHNNWVHRGDTVSGSYNYHGVYINHNTDQSFVAVVRDNVFTRGAVDMGHHIINSKAMGLSYHNNSVAGSKGGLFANSVGNFRYCEIENNLNLVQHHDVLFSPNAVLFLPVARQRWQLSGNLSHGRPREGNFLSLGEPHPAEIRLLSNDPLHRDFMRVDPATIQVPEGQPFPGALPPGPAPEDGDWFTRLQERFEDALQHLPEEERGHWTQSVELPEFSTKEPQSIPVVTDEALELDFTYLKSGFFKRVHSYQPLMAEHTSKIPDNLILPQSVAKPHFGQISSGDLKWSYIVDSPSEFPPKVYVDANADGDFNNDPPLTWHEKKSGLEFYYEAEFDVRLPDGKPAKVIANTRFFPNKLLHRTDFGYFTSVMLGTDKVTLVCEGLFTDKAYIRIFPEKSQPKRGARIGIPFEFNEGKYLLNLIDDKVFIKSEKSSETIQPARPALRLDGRNASFLEYDGPQPRRWVELDEKEELKFTFEELRRTDRFVTIIDRKRNMTIRLPLGGGRVLYSTDGEEKWSALGNFQIAETQEDLAEQQNEPMAADGMAPGGPAGNANRPNNDPPDRINRVQLPKEMREILKLPGMSEKMDRLERDYLRYKRGFFVYGRITSQNPQIDPRLIEARMPVGPGGHFIDLVADAGRPVGFVLHGHEYVSVVPTGPPNDHEGVFVENLGNLVMMPLRSAEAKSTLLEIERLDLRGRRQPVSVNFRITTEVPELNYFSETIVPRGSEDLEGFSIQGQTLANGKFSLKGLSPLPTKYRLQINVPGHLPLNETLGLNRSTERFVIEEKIPIQIETILRKDDKFDLANVQKAWLYGGDSWKFNMPKPVPGAAGMGGAMGGNFSPFTSGNGGSILQANRVLTFAVRGMTTSAKDLGEGTLQQFLDQDPKKVMKFRDREFQITPGHVYLLRSYYTSGMGYVPGKQEDYEMQHSDYALVRVTLQ